MAISGEKRLLSRSLPEGSPPERISDLMPAQRLTAEEWVERLLADAMVAIGAVHGVEPPKVKVYLDYKRFLEAASVLNVEARQKLETEAVSEGLEYYGKRKRFVAGAVKTRRNMLLLEEFGLDIPRTYGYTMEVTSSGSDLESIIWVDASEKSKVPETAKAEAAHAVLYKLSRRFGLRRPREVDETLENIHLFLLTDATKRQGLIEEAKDTTNAVERLEGFQHVFVARRAFLHAIDRFKSDADLEDAAVIMAASKYICGENDPKAFEKITAFLDFLSGREDSDPGILRRAASEQREATKKIS